jgi:mannose-1-phosphate guanylyltransferase
MFSVCRFWEKPSAETASLLWRHGCFWNSLVMAAQLSTLLGLFMSALPGMYLSFAAIRPVLGTLFEQKTMEALYQDLESVNFSDRVLEKYPASLAVLPVTGVEWRDLGEPERVLALLSRLGHRLKWLPSATYRLQSPERASVIIEKRRFSNAKS